MSILRRYKRFTKIVPVGDQRPHQGILMQLPLKRNQTMKTTMKRLSAGMATAVAVTLLPGVASAQVISRIYSYTTKGATQCHSAANAAGPGYYCTTTTIA